MKNLSSMSRILGSIFHCYSYLSFKKFLADCKLLKFSYDLVLFGDFTEVKIISTYVRNTQLLSVVDDLFFLVIIYPSHFFHSTYGW